MDTRYELIIIGSGPAGMSSAVYAGRSGLKCAMIEESAPGGKMVKTAEIANYPGIKLANGADLAFQMYDHSISFGCESLFNKVEKIIDGDVKKVVCSDGTIYETDAVIIATGTKERLMNIPKEKELTGKGVSYCAVCDAAFYRNKVVTVIGGGNSALEESVYLTQFADKVNIVIRRDVFRADKITVEKALANEKINVIKKNIPVEIVETEGKVSALIIENVDTKERTTLETSGVFPYIGADPCTEMCEGLDILNENGYIKVNNDMSTSIKGIYGAGDVCDKILRQVVTATNDGAIAAQSAFHYIKNK